MHCIKATVATVIYASTVYGKYRYVMHHFTYIAWIAQSRNSSIPTAEVVTRSETLGYHSSYVGNNISLLFQVIAPSSSFTSPLLPPWYLI